MPVPTTDPVISIKNLLVAQWNAANTASVTPDFHTGWWNPHSTGPQVTIGNQSEAFQGESGYGAIEGGGGGPVQIAAGVLFINCWATRLEGQANPKSLVYAFAQEVRRIIFENYNQITNLTHISVLAIDDVPPRPDASPMVFRKSVTVGFRWSST